MIGRLLLLFVLFAFSASAQEKIQVILDTDIGDDIDDAMALIYAMKHPRLEVVGVTTVMDGTYRAVMASKLLELLGRDDVPVFRGARNRLLRGSQAMPGAETAPQMSALAGQAPPRRAIEQEFGPNWIVRQVKARPGKITLVPYGPMTNIALAIIQEPRLKEYIKEIVLMGGALNRSRAEHNLLMDPEATRIVFESGLPITMVGLDVTMKCRLTPQQVDTLVRDDRPLIKLLSGFLRGWQRGNPQQMPVLHDPLAVALVADRSLVKTERMIVDIETRAEFTAGATIPRRGPPEELERRGVQVALDVDADRFVREFMETLLR